MPRKKIKIEKASRNYTFYGHDGYSDGKFNEKKPNYMWGFVKGKIYKEAETQECKGHGEVRDWRDKDWDFCGRYDAKRKIISCSIHVESIFSFRKLPKTLVSYFEQIFPDAKKIVTFN